MTAPAEYAARSPALLLLGSGAYVDLSAPETLEIGIGDIAHGLSQLCRFTGQCRRFYSVAEHSVHASHVVDPAHALAALLHDAAEAVLGDVARPLKGLLPDYARLEARMERALLARFGLSAPLPAAVRLADLRLLKAEQVQAMGNADPWPVLAGIAPAEVTLGFWPPDVARARFLTRFTELTGEEQR